MFDEKTKIVYAKFIGADGSMGLRNGQSYYILLEDVSDYNILHSDWKYRASMLNNKSFFTCPYSSLESFSDNWEVREIYSQEQAILPSPTLEADFRKRWRKWGK